MRRSIKDYPKSGSNLMCLSNKIIQNIKKRNQKIFYYVPEIIASGYKKKFIYYHRKERKINKSQSSFLSRIFLSFENFTIYSVWPLKFLFLFGTIILLISMIYISLIVYAYFDNSFPFRGYSPIVILILFFGGINLFTLGIIGEYLTAILKQLRQDDLFEIKDTINLKKN